jgi:hypothetical protein
MAITASKISEGPWESLEDFLISDGYTQTMQVFDALPPENKHVPELTLHADGSVTITTTFNDEADRQAFREKANEMFGPGSLRKAE